ncbi:MAG: hypothetical protein DRR19_18260 [Candidatus Parabeggiatoa sp. nov. 1]|nr:MAG: hypothetical protein DRR19_18260 [Gammaproteobacteria bacterium]
MNLPKTATPIEWRAILGALIALSLSLIISVLLILGSQRYHDLMNEWERQQRNAFQTVNAKYYNLQEALKIVNGAYLKEFNQLIKEGFFTIKPLLTVEEQRLKMVDKIKTLLFDLELITADYTLLKNKLYDFQDIIIIEPEFKTYQTQLILNLELLHEGDVLKLIETIEFQHFTGLFNLQRCDIKRLRDKIDVNNVSNPYFKANCVLAWYISEIEEDI